MSNINPQSGTLSNLNLYPLEVVSRYTTHNFKSIKLYLIWAILIQINANLAYLLLEIILFAVQIKRLKTATILSDFKKALYTRIFLDSILHMKLQWGLS